MEWGSYWKSIERRRMVEVLSSKGLVEGKCGGLAGRWHLACGGGRGDERRRRR